MRHLHEYRNGDVARRIAEEIMRITTRPWSLMEVCGGQTHSILRHGIDQLLPESIELLHGPGCPVCVTPLETIDKALAIASQPNVIFCTFGDMLRVPGSEGDLFTIKSRGGDVRILYSPIDAVRMAMKHPDRQVVLLAIGFETTAPANAMAIRIAKQQGVKNFSALVSQVLVPPAIRAVVAAPSNRVQAFLAAGHVCTVTGYQDYHAICDTHRVPIVVTGFEPLDLLDGIRRAILQLEKGEARVENAYERVVDQDGNMPARAVLEEVFEVCDRPWRGIGVIPMSGYRLRHAYQEWDAEQRFDVAQISPEEPPVCRAGEVLRGVLKPHQCPAFGKECTPRTPLGATMVSSEGACAAYFHYGTLEQRNALGRIQ